MNDLTQPPPIKVISTPVEMHRIRARLGDSVGLVPTMGYLHEGHLSLVDRARAENNAVIVTIFVNPTQFGPQEDLASYPRDLDQDLELLRQAGVDIVFTPSAADMYAPGFQSWVEVSELSQPLEGAFRPGHFRGVTTIVSMLFNLTRPTRAYFGQKDAQQAIILRRMVQDLHYAIDLIVCPTIREPHGLALSSRNSYLTADQRRRASILYEALGAAQKLYEDGARQAEGLRQAMLDILAAEPEAEVIYVSVADLASLRELAGHIDQPALLSLAVRMGKARLIDNVWLGTEVR